MFDLIGYWFGVTLYVVPPLFYAYLVFESIARDEVTKITNGKASWGPWKKWFDSKSYTERVNIKDSIGLSVIITIVLWFVAFVGWFAKSVQEEVTLISLVSNICEVTSSVTGIFASFVIAWAFYVFVIRKGLISLFNLKEKVDKL